MKYLLDTHVLLWWLDNNPKLSLPVKNTISNPLNTIFVSSVSTWEINTKKSLGKLTVPDNIPDIIRECRFIELPITIDHSCVIGTLVPIHQDPFDRMLIAQAISEDLVLITSDTMIQKYPIATMKA